MLLTLVGRRGRSFVVQPLPASRASAAIRLLPVLCGLFLAPWLTMLCRSPIAGAVFTLAFPGCCWSMGELLGVATYGHGLRCEAFEMAVVWCGTLVLCAIGAVMSWRMFMRLEAIDGRDPEVRLPRWLRSARRGRPHRSRPSRNPIWLLVKKELRLQQMALAFAALYLLRVGVPLVSDGQHGRCGRAGISSTVLTFLHVGLLAMLIGSLASAGERQMRHARVADASADGHRKAMDGQSRRRIRTGDRGRPRSAHCADLLLVTKSSAVCPHRLSSSGPAMTIAFLLATGSLYVSSLCSTGLRALVMSLPATLGLGRS